MSEGWIAFARFLLPVLTGLLLMLLLVRLLTLWQDRSRRTWRNIWFVLMYLSFFILCAARSLNLPLLWVAISYMFLVLFFIPCVWCDWWNFIQFLQTKNTKFVAEGADAQLMTLDKLASNDVHAVLDATPVEAESSEQHVVLEATPVKEKVTTNG